MMLDFECVSICYHKYIFAAQTISNLIEDDGRKYASEYVLHSLGDEKRDRFKDNVFPIGGHKTD